MTLVRFGGCLVGLLKRAVLLRLLFDNVSLAVAMARGIKATLLCAHGPTVLTNPEPCSAAHSQQPGAFKTRIHALM